MELCEEMFLPQRMTQADVTAFRERYFDDPVLFFREILRKAPDANQAKMLAAIRDNDRVAVGSGRGIGKSVVMAGAGIWFISTRGHAYVPVYSNTYEQALRTTWSTALRLLSGSLIRSWFHARASSIAWAGEPEKGSMEAVSWSEASIESTSGIHREHLLVLCDEASGMPETLLDNLYAGLTETDNRMVLTSNWTRTTGWFNDRMSDRKWASMSIDSRTSEWTDKDFIADLIERHGEDSDAVRVQVRGLPPKSSSGSILGLEEIARAVARKQSRRDGAEIVMGMDVGGSGDPSAWVVRQGATLLEVSEADTPDEDRLIEAAVAVGLRWRPSVMCYDATGMGFHLKSPLARALPHTRVIGRNFGESSPDADCHNMRAWMYRRVRQWVVESEGSLNGFPELVRQLKATEWSIGRNGKRIVADKGIICATLGRSPDHADALALSCAIEGDLEAHGMKPTPGGAYKSLSQMIMQAAKLS